MTQVDNLDTVEVEVQLFGQFRNHLVVTQQDGVADAFYYFCVPLSFLSAHWLQVLLFYISIVIGNFIGCNLYRMVMNEHTGMQKQ